MVIIDVVSSTSQGDYAYNFTTKFRFISCVEAIPALHMLIGATYKASQSIWFVRFVDLYGTNSLVSSKVASSGGLRYVYRSNGYDLIGTWAIENGLLFFAKD